MNAIAPNLSLVVVAGFLIATGVYLLLERALTRLLLGIVLTEEVSAQVEAQARAAGFLVNPAKPNVIRLAPPLILTEEQGAGFVAALPAILLLAAHPAAAQPGMSPVPAGLTAADRQQLLAKVRDTFKAQPFIDRIEIIPDTYLRPRGGFDNLEQIARLQGLDIVALVSYDQVADTGETAASFLYWTIIGAYTVPATRNQVSTFVETTVFHVDSRTLLLRAPGQDQRDAGSTAIRVGDTRERLEREGFRAAMDDMSTNLDVAIADFSTRVREEGQVKLVDRRSGGSWRGRGGGGSLGLWELGALLGALALLLAARRRG